MAIFEQNDKVKVYNVGKSGLISNVGILHILENIAFSHSDEAGLGILDIPIKHLSWFLLAWKVKVIKRVPYNTDLRVRTWARPANKFQTYRDFEIYDEHNNLICIASSKWALIDTEKNSIARISDNIMLPYQPESKTVFEEAEIKKIDEPSSFSQKYVYQTQRRDIDVNQHMHNLNYLCVAYEALPEDVYLSSECNNIEIMYKKGIKLGDTVTCLYSNVNFKHYVTMKSVDEKTLYAIVKLY